MTRRFYHQGRKTRFVGATIVCSMVMVLGSLLLPSVSASTWTVYPDLSYWTANVMVDSKWGSCYSEYGYDHAAYGTSMAMNVGQSAFTTGVGTVTLSMMYESRTQTFTCPATGSYELNFCWTPVTWAAGWSMVTDMVPFSTSEAQIAIYIGADVWDVTSSRWASRGEHNLKIIDEHDSDTCYLLPLPPNTKTWNPPTTSYTITFYQDLTGGKSYRFYSPVYVTTFASAVGAAFSESWAQLAGAFAYVYVWDGASASGGCVAEGTMITMADGSQLPVECIKKGDRVLGYDVEEKTIVEETVRYVDSSWVSQLLIINDGLLELTLSDQPIYAKHGDWTGWVENPEDLELDWEIFLPIEDEWLMITSLDVIDGSFHVYDVGTTNPDTFIADGVLLDIKKK